MKNLLLVVLLIYCSQPLFSQQRLIIDNYGGGDGVVNLISENLELDIDHVSSILINALEKELDLEDLVREDLRPYLRSEDSNFEIWKSAYLEARDSNPDDMETQLVLRSLIGNMKRKI